MPSARNDAEFLLLDRLFPRSIIYSIQRAEDCMARGQGWTCGLSAASS